MENGSFRRIVKIGISGLLFKDESVNLIVIFNGFIGLFGGYFLFPLRLSVIWVHSSFGGCF